MDDPATVAAPTDKPWYFKPGNTEYRARKDRIAERVAQLAAEYNTTSAISRQLLEIAAVHLDTAARTHSNALRSRATRLAMKVLASLELKPEPAPTSLDELAQRHKQEAAANE